MRPTRILIATMSFLFSILPGLCGNDGGVKGRTPVSRSGVVTSTNRLDGSYRSQSGSALEVEKLKGRRLKFTGLATRGAHNAYIFCVANQLKDSTYVFKKGSAKIILNFNQPSKVTVTNVGNFANDFKFDSGVSLAGTYNKTSNSPHWNVDSEDTPWESE